MSEAALPRAGGMISGATAILAAGDVTGRLCTMLAWILVARTLGGDGFGLVAWGLAIVAYASIAADAGLAVFGTRELARNSGTAAVHEIRALRLGTASLVTLMVVLMAWGFVDEARWTVLAASALWLVPMSLNPEWILQGQHRIAAVGYLRGGLGLSLLLIVSIWSWSPAAEPASAVATRALAEGVIVVLAALATVTTGFRHLSLPSLENARGYLKQSLPMAGATLLTGVYAANLDVLVLGEARSMTEAGLYAAAFRLYLMLCVLPKLLLVPAYPRFATLAGDRVALQREVDRFYAGALAIGLLAAALTWTLSSELIELLFGASFADAAPILRMLTAAAVAVLLNAPFPSVLLANGKAISALTCFGSALVISVVVNLTATPAWGMPAAATAVILAEVAVLLTGWAACRRHLGLSLGSGAVGELLTAVAVWLAAIQFRDIAQAAGLGPAATVVGVTAATAASWGALVLGRWFWRRSAAA